MSADVDPDYATGSDLTYLHGVATDMETEVPGDLDTIEVPAGSWAVFRASGAYPTVLQEAWAATATDWFPSQPWRLREGPSIVAGPRPFRGLHTPPLEILLPLVRAGACGRIAPPCGTGLIAAHTF